MIKIEIEWEFRDDRRYELCDFFEWHEKKFDVVLFENTDKNHWFDERYLRNFFIELRFNFEVKIEVEVEIEIEIIIEIWIEIEVRIWIKIEIEIEVKIIFEIIFWIEIKFKIELKK